MSFKKIIVTGCAVAAMGFSLSAMAGATLTITNNTNYDSASFVNGLACSSAIPGLNGVTPRHGENKLTYVELYIACANHEANCTAVIYGNNSCCGAKSTDVCGNLIQAIGTATINTSTGLQSVNVTDPRFVATWTKGAKGTVTIGCAASNPELCTPPSL